MNTTIKTPLRSITASSLRHPAAAALLLATLSALQPIYAVTDYWNGDINTTWDTDTNNTNWKDLVTAGNSKAFTTGDDVTFGVASPIRKEVVVTSNGVTAGKFTITSGSTSPWNFSGGTITAFSSATEHAIAQDTNFSGMSVNFARDALGVTAGVKLTANVVLNSSEVKTSTWSGGKWSFLVASGKTLTLAGKTILDATSIAARTDQGTIIINDNAVLKGKNFGSNNGDGKALQKIQLNGGTLTATTLTDTGGGVDIKWSGGVIQARDSNGISKGTANTSGVVNNITLLSNTAGTFNGLPYEVGTPGMITIDNAITEGTPNSRFGVTLIEGGTLKLNGQNTYTGATTVNKGTLILGTGGSIDTSTTIVVGSEAIFTNNSGAVVRNSFNLTEGAKLDGTSGYTTTATKVTGNLGDGGFTTITLGTFTMSNNITFELTNVREGEFDIFNNGSGSFATFSIAGTGLDNIAAGQMLIAGGFSYTFDGNNMLRIMSTAIPEPATYATLAGLGILGFAVCRRRKSAA